MIAVDEYESRPLAKQRIARRFPAIWEGGLEPDQLDGGAEQRRSEGVLRTD
jgi:hypothetical protein